MFLCFKAHQEKRKEKEYIPKINKGPKGDHNKLNHTEGKEDDKI